MNSFRYYPLTVSPSGPSFTIAVGADENDFISQGIADGDYSFPEHYSLLLSQMKPGNRVLDLGANIGTFSLAAAALGCDVVAVEGAPRNAELLSASVAQNGFDQLRVVSAAVSDQPGTVEFIQAGPFGFVATNQETDLPRIKVPAITVDDLLASLGWEHVDFIKMDIEGAEVAAIHGMSHLLRREDAPPILFESNGHTLPYFGESPQTLLGALEANGYTSYLVEPGRLTRVSAAMIQPDCIVDYLAMKGPMPHIAGYQIVPSMTHEEMVNRIVATAAYPHEHYRAYAARMLAKADLSISSDPQVVSVLELLKFDPSAEVRAATAWFSTGQVARLLHFKQLEHQADVMLRDYEVKSQIPLIGGLIAWARRNMTSHLREPYLDRIIERQVELNRSLVREVRALAVAQSALFQKLAHMEAELNEVRHSQEKAD